MALPYIRAPEVVTAYRTVDGGRNRCSVGERRLRGNPRRSRASRWVTNGMREIQAYLPNPDARRVAPRSLLANRNLQGRTGDRTLMTLRSQDFKFFPAPATIVNHRDNCWAISHLEPAFRRWVRRRSPFRETGVAH